VHLRCKELPHQPEIIGVFSKEVYKMWNMLINSYFVDWKACVMSTQRQQ
jgi:hypothetical protein